jgi:hypothetical protein
MNQYVNSQEEHPMAFREVDDNPDGIGTDSFGSSAFESRLKQAEDVRPGTFRYSDSSLGGEVRTSTDNPGSAQSIAQAEVFRRDGSSDVVGTARYSVAGGEAKLYGGSVTAPNYGTEEALLDEIGDQARSQGADRLQVWVPDGDAEAAKRWSAHGFQPSGDRNPGAAGITWEKRL